MIIVILIVVIIMIVIIGMLIKTLIKGNPNPPADCGFAGGLQVVSHALVRSPGYFVWWLWHRSLCLNW